MRAMGPSERSLVVDGVALTVRVERKRVKNVNARLLGSVLAISAPQRLPEAELERIIPELASKLVRRVRAREVNSAENVAQRARSIAARFPEPPRVTEVRFVATQTRSWGSYSPTTGVVRLSLVLRQMPGWVLEAVLAHELAHAFHPNHSRAFWRLLRQVCPSTERAHGFLAGVSWLAGRWQSLPPVERALLEVPEGDGGDDD